LVVFHSSLITHYSSLINERLLNRVATHNIAVFRHLVHPGEEPPVTTESSPSLPPLPATPYRSVAPYDREQRALFAGRDEEVRHFVELLDGSDTRLVVLHGPSGAGKTSFLLAGVLPLLEERPGYGLPDSTAPGEGLPLVLDSGRDPTAALALALADYAAEPLTYTNAAGETISVELSGLLNEFAAPQSTLRLQNSAAPEGVPGTEQIQANLPQSPPAVPPAENLLTAASPAPALGRALSDDPSRLGQLLAALSQRLPFRLVVVLDHCEEIFSHAHTLRDQDRGFGALEMLRRAANTPGNFKLIVVMDTEYYGRLMNQLGPEAALGQGIREFLLEAPDEPRLVEAILRPTVDEPIPYTSEVPAQKYQFSYADGAAENLGHQLRVSAEDWQESPLPLLQILCTRLYDLVQQRQVKVIEVTDVKTIADLKHGLGKHLQALVDRLFFNKLDRRAFRALAIQLYERRGDGLPVPRWVPPSELARHWRGLMPFEQMFSLASAPDAGLLRLSEDGSSEQAEPLISLGHPFLAIPVAEWDDEEQRKTLRRKAIIDTLWIMIPIVIVVGTFAWVRMRVAEQNATVAEQRKQIIQSLQEKFLEQAQSHNQTEADERNWQQAQAAWRRSDLPTMVRSLEALEASSLAQRSPRGFEWFYLWQQAHQGQQTLKKHRAMVTAVAASADGKYLASASLDRTVILWDAKEARSLQVYPEKGADKDADRHDAFVFAVAFSPDNKKLASAGKDGIVKLHDLEDLAKPKPPLSWTGHKNTIRCVAFSADGKLLASGDDDGLAIVWDTANGKQRTTLKGHEGTIHAVAFTPDSKTVVSASADRTVRLWDVDSGKEVGVLEKQPGPLFAVAITSDGKTLATGGAEKQEDMEVGLLKLWDVATRKEQKNLTGHQGAVFSVAFTMDGKTLASASKDLTIRLWDVAKGQEQRLLRGHIDWVRSVAFAPDGKSLISGSDDQTVRIWQSEPKQRDVLQAQQGTVWAVALTRDAKTLASGGGDGTVKLWNLDGELLHTLKGHGKAVRAVAFTRDGKTLASASWSLDKDGDLIGEVKLWDVAKGKEIKTLSGGKGPLYAVAFDATGQVVAAGGQEKIVRRWIRDKDTYKELRHLEGHTGPIRALAFAPNAPDLASAGDGEKILIFRGSTGEIIPLEGHTNRVTSLEFSWNGKWLASGSLDGSAKFWELKSLQAFTYPHPVGVLAVAVHPNTRTLTSALADHTLRLWNTTKDVQRLVLTGHHGPVRSVAFATDKKTLSTILASGSEDGTVRLWRGSPEPPTLEMLEE
jgi:WD40 repeat protein